MKLTQAGIDLIKQFESCRLEVYKDIKGLFTVGWGHRTDLPLGTKITQLEADELLTGDLAGFVDGIKKLLRNELNDNQFSACVSLVYNIGLGSFKSSTLLRLLNIGNMYASSLEFIKWDHANGVEVSGLLRRRIAEQKLFNS